MFDSIFLRPHLHVFEHRTTAKKTLKPNQFHQDNIRHKLCEQHTIYLLRDKVLCVEVCVRVRDFVPAIQFMLLLLAHFIRSICIIQYEWMNQTKHFAYNLISWINAKEFNEAEETKQQPIDA